MPTVLMGDLNEWRRYSGCLIDFGRTYGIVPTEPRFPPAGRSRLDRIMAGPGIEVIDCGTHFTPLPGSPRPLAGLGEAAVAIGPFVER